MNPSRAVSAFGIARPLAVGAMFAVLIAIAFGPALHAPFDFDDGPAITENATIRQLSPLGVPLHPLADTPVSGRPITNLSFALNYALNARLGVAQSPVSESPQQTVGFHAVNLLIHLATALLLLAVGRRTIRDGKIPGVRPDADWFALVLAALWLVHPLQTEAVDYVTQRTELLVSFFFLAALYASIRAWPAATARRATIAWSVVAVGCAVLGTASKEVMVTAPLIVILYDRAFIAADWIAPWRDPRRRTLYIALTVSVALTFALVSFGARSATVGLNLGLPWYRYLYTQGWAVAHYLRLAFWPVGLAFDYGRNPALGLSALPGCLLAVALCVPTAYAWRSDRWRWAGFLGAFFFIVLAPSSSLIPIRTEIAAERRMYLPLAAVIAFVVALVMHWLRRDSEGSVSRLRSRIRASAAAMLSIMAIGAFVALSHARSALYDDLRARWTDAIRVTPTNGRAYDMLAAAELRATPARLATADSLLARASAVDSAFTPALVRRSTIALAEGRIPDAVALLKRALAIHPNDAMATNQLGTVYLSVRRADLALPYLRAYADFSPNGASLTRLALAYLMTRDLDRAMPLLTRAAQLDPASAESRRYLAAALIERERGAEAIVWLDEAIRLDPASAELSALLSLARAQTRDATGAAQAADHAAALAPDNPSVFILVGRAMLVAGELLDAEVFLERASRLSPNDPQALARLAMVKGRLGKRAEAVQLVQRALRAAPQYLLALEAKAQLESRR